MPDAFTRITGEFIAYLGEHAPCELSREASRSLSVVLLSRTLWRGLDRIGRAPNGDLSDAILETEWKNWGEDYIYKHAWPVFERELKSSCKEATQRTEPGEVVRLSLDEFDRAVDRTIDRMQLAVSRARNIAAAGASEGPADPDIDLGPPYGDQALYPFCGEPDA